MLETARAVKFQSCLPNGFWGECVEAATYIINRMPLTVLGNKSPYELVYNRKPSLAHLRVIGCLAFATNLKKGDKFAPKAKKSILLGYAVSQKGYKLLDLETKVIFISRDVIFHEKVFPFQEASLEDTTDSIFPVISHVEDCALTPCVISATEQPDIITDPPYPVLDTATVSSDTEVEVLSSVVSPQLPDVIRKSNRPVKPPLWHTDYVLSKQKN